MVDVNKIIDIEDLYGKKRIDETFNVINYNEIRQYRIPHKTSRH